MPVYAILIQSDEEGIELLPKYFNTYNDALNEVKRRYNGEVDGDGNYFPNWADEGNTVTHAEAHNSDGTLASDLNLTKLYIEKGVHISIRRLVKNPTRASRASRAAGGGGGYSRKRHSKRNTKNSRKHRI